MTETTLRSTPQAGPPGIRVWDLPTRLFHWLLVVAIAVAFLSSDEDSALAAWHQAAGWVAALLIVFRLVWGFAGGEHARFADFLRPGKLATHLRHLSGGRAAPEAGHNPLGGLAIVAILGLVAATVATGVLTLKSGEEDLHEAVAYGMLALVAVHIVAVVAMSIVSRENLVRAMLTGRKPATRHPGAADARSASRLALPLALVAVAAAAYGITRIDPHAFGPHAAQAERGEGGSQAAAGEREAD